LKPHARHPPTSLPGSAPTWDERSVTYGIGPECRRFATPEFLSQMLEVMKLALAEADLVKPGGDPDEQ
jgi:hypothetical protein